jgi:hypothetical protein
MRPVPHTVHRPPQQPPLLPAVRCARPGVVGGGCVVLPHPVSAFACAHGSTRVASCTRPLTCASLPPCHARPNNKVPRGSGAGLGREAAHRGAEGREEGGSLTSLARTFKRLKFLCVVHLPPTLLITSDSLPTESVYRHRQDAAAPPPHGAPAPAPDASRISLSNQAPRGVCSGAGGRQQRRQQRAQQL